MDSSRGDRAYGTLTRRDLLERRYPYLSGGARAGLGTRSLRAGLLNWASRS